MKHAHLSLLGKCSDGRLIRAYISAYSLLAEAHTPTVCTEDTPLLCVIIMDYVKKLRSAVGGSGEVRWYRASSGWLACARRQAETCHQVTNGHLSLNVTTRLGGAGIQEGLQANGRHW